MEEKGSEVRSPCVQICTLDPADEVCTGCGRTRSEIWEWTRCGDERKRQILERCALRKRDLQA